MLVFVTSIVSLVLFLMIRLYPDINTVLKLNVKRIQLETSFNEVGTSKMLVGLDYTQQHERYHKCCADDGQADTITDKEVD